MIRFYLIISFTLLTIACTNEQAKKSIARVEDQYLSIDELENRLPKNLDSSEKELIKNQIIESWIIDNLLAFESQKIKEPKEIEELVEAYRKQLYSSFYENQYLKANLDTLVEQKEIDTFYSKNKELFPLEESVIQVLAIKVAKQSDINPNIKNLINQPSAFDKLVEDYQYEVDEIYYDKDNWLPYSTLIEIFPITGEQILKNEIKKGYKKIISDDSFNYYFYFLNVKKSGYLPINLASNKIVSIIMNERRYKLLAKMRNDLKNKAIASGKAEILN